MEKGREIGAERSAVRTPCLCDCGVSGASVISISEARLLSVEFIITTITLHVGRHKAVEAHAYMSRCDLLLRVGRPAGRRGDVIPIA